MPSNVLGFDMPCILCKSEKQTEQYAIFIIQNHDICFALASRSVNPNPTIFNDVFDAELCSAIISHKVQQINHLQPEI